MFSEHSVRLVMNPYIGLIVADTERSRNFNCEIANNFDNMAIKAELRNFPTLSILKLQAIAEKHKRDYMVKDSTRFGFTGYGDGI